MSVLIILLVFFCSVTAQDHHARVGALMMKIQGQLDAIQVLQESVKKTLEEIRGSHSGQQSGTLTLPAGSFFDPMKNRLELGNLAQRRGYKVGVELGVQAGHFSDGTLQGWRSCQRYYLVDIWRQQENYVDGANVVQEKQDALYLETQTRLARFSDKTVFLRNYTREAVSIIPDPVDYVYVDARHDYCGALDDIQMYWPKIRSGGMMAGHDFIDAAEMNNINSAEHWEVCMNGTTHPGAVRGAVLDFFGPLGLPVHVTYRDGPWNSWMVTKP